MITIVGKLYKTFPSESPNNIPKVIPTRIVVKVTIKAFLNRPFQSKSIDKNEEDISSTKLGR